MIPPEKFSLGLDIGGTNLRLALVNSRGGIVGRRRGRNQATDSRHQFLASLSRELQSLREESRQLGGELVAIGAGVPGLLDRQGVLLSSVNLLPLEGINLRQELAAMTGLPVAVLNDANAAALGEKCYGAGRSYSSLLLFTLGTGVGSGLILDGRLWTGSDGVAAEYGHATVEPLGHLCPCGNRGCLEQYASATALLRMAKVGILDDAASTLATLAPDELDASAIAHAARGGDQLALACFAVVGHYLGIAAATIVNLLNLDAIIIAGGVSASFDLFADELQEEIRKRAFALPAARVKVLKGELGDDAGLLGAAAAAWDLVP